MLLELFVAIGIGIILGIFTGITPGVHINLISAIVVFYSAKLTGYFSPIIISVAVVSMAVTHTFFDALPAIFFGAPEPSTALSVLPGHKMLLEGKGFEAAYLTILGSFSSLVVMCISAPVIFFVIKYSYELISKFVPYLLILISSLLILREKNKIDALVIFLLSGTLGFAVFSCTSLSQPLLPLLSGLFGISSISLSIFNNTKIPKQVISFPFIKFFGLVKSVSSALFSGSLCSFLPGLGPAQATMISSLFVKQTKKRFLITIGGISTINISVSFITLYLINKARNGAVVAISEINSYFTINHLILFLAVALLVGSVSAIIAIKIAKRFALMIAVINYKLLGYLIISFIVILTYIFTGLTGVLILATSSFLGIYAYSKQISKSHLMACLILPVIVWLL